MPSNDSLSAPHPRGRQSKLKEALAARGLDNSGNKPALVERLWDALAPERAAAEVCFPPLLLFGDPFFKES